ncbi:nucleotide exchange factor GrpE [Candidatus Parcubacteria bacterium]|nr:nucleotide exchange factor GrpE [Candidatus Parcubacteria bacterium]
MNDQDKNIEPETTAEKEHEDSKPKAEEAVTQDKAEEYLNNWKRERADFLNYKKNEARRIEEFARYAHESVILEVMELLDDLEQAAKELKNPGLDQIIKKFVELLKKYGVERIKTDGSFDPAFHEAVETEKDGTKIEEVRAGYMMHDKVIRPARVRIIK